MTTSSNLPELWDEDGHSVAILRKLLADDLSIFAEEAGPVFVRIVENGNPDTGGRVGLQALEAMDAEDMLPLILSFQLALGYGRQFEAVLYSVDEDDSSLWSGLLIYSSGLDWAPDEETDYDDLTIAELLKEGMTLARPEKTDDEDEGDE